MSVADDKTELQNHIRDLESRYAQLRVSHDRLLKERDERDSFQQARGEEGLARSVKYYKDLFNLNPLPMWIYDHETHFFLDVNEAATSHYGYTREEFLQMSVQDIRPGDERKRLEKDGGQLSEEGSTHHGHWRHWKKNGEIIHVEITAQLISYAGRTAALVLSHDISQKVRLESKLVHINRRLQAAQQIANIGYWEMNLVTNEWYWSDQTYRIFGLEKTNAKPDYETFFNLIHPDDREYFLDKQRSVLKGDRSVTAEHRIVLQDGTVKTIMERATLLDDENGTPIILEGTVQDITERKKAEDELINKEKRFRALIKNSADGITVMSADGVVIDISPSGKRILGYEAGELIGKSRPDLIHPDDLARVEETFVKVLEDPAGTAFFEFRHKMPDGHYKWLECICHNLLEEPYLNAVVLNFRDISERKIAEVELFTERNQLRTLIDNLPDSIYIKDVMGRKTVSNGVDMKLMGAMSEAEFIGKTDLDIFAETIGASSYADDMQVIQTGKAIYNREECFTDADGRKTWLLTSKVPIHNEFGEINGLLGIGRIITERKRSEEALRDSNERFVYATKATFDAIWDWDILNDHLYWGDGYEKIFGYKIPAQADNSIYSFDNIHPDDRAEVFNSIHRLVKGTGVNWTSEYRYRKANGEYAHVQDKGIIIRNEDGHAIRMIGAMQDVTEHKLADESARKTQEKFTSLVNTIDGIVWEADGATFAFTYVSKHAEKLLGYPANDWIENSDFWASHIHPDDRKWAVNYCMDQTQKRKEHQFEYRMIAADGRIVWLADFVTVISDGTEPVQLRGIMVDITERKNTEEALAKEKQLLRLLLDNLPDYIYVKDKNARIAIINKANVKDLGFESEDEMLGKTIVDLLGEEYGGESLKDDWEVLLKGEPLMNRERLVVNKNQRARWLLSSKIPIKDPDNQVIGFVGINRDITERKKIEETLVKERKLLRILIDNLPDYIYVKDKDCRHIINNRANIELLGFSEEAETLGKTIVDLMGEDVAGFFMKDDQEVISSGKPIMAREEPIVSAEGVQRWLLTTKIPFKDENNTVIGLVGISRDITERKAKDEELTEKNSQLKDLSKHLQGVREEERKILAREVHDELGQLVSAVKMDIDWLTIRLPDLQEIPKKRLDHASSTADLLINTIRKIASTLRPSMLDDFGLNTALSWQCKEFAAANGVPCEFEQLYDDSDMPLEMKTELFRICQESLTNVMRHASATRVKVNVNETSEGLQLCISDNGNGFDMTQKKNTLGLIGMRERALSINGRLVVKSAIGKGTSVCAIVPKNKLV